MLTNNEIKVIIKVMNSLESRGILLKGATKKITSQKGGLLNFLGPLMKVGLPLIKNVVTHLAKIVLIPCFGTNGGSTSNRRSYLKQNLGLRKNINNFWWKSELWKYLNYMKILISC